MKSAADHIPRSVSGLVAALLVGTAISWSVLVHAAAHDDASATFADVVDAVGGRVELERHAGFGNIFAGQVLAVPREDSEKWGPQDVSNRIIYYRVNVEETLRGDAKGQVEIKYSGADAMSPDTRAFGPLEVGNRYLFSAGALSEDGTYPVYAGMGTILVPNNEVKAELIPEFSGRLIPTAEAEERKAIEAATAEADRQRKQ